MTNEASTIPRTSLGSEPNIAAYSFAEVIQYRMLHSMCRRVLLESCAMARIFRNFEI